MTLKILMDSDEDNRLPTTSDLFNNNFRNSRLRTFPELNPSTTFPSVFFGGNQVESDHSYASNEEEPELQHNTSDFERNSDQQQIEEAMKKSLESWKIEEKQRKQKEEEERKKKEEEERKKRIEEQLRQQRNIQFIEDENDDELQIALLLSKQIAEEKSKEQKSSERKSIPPLSNPSRNQQPQKIVLQETKSYPFENWDTDRDPVQKKTFHNTQKQDIPQVDDDDEELQRALELSRNETSKSRPSLSSRTNPPNKFSKPSTLFFENRISNQPLSRIEQPDQFAKRLQEENEMLQLALHENLLKEQQQQYDDDAFNRAVELSRKEYDSKSSFESSTASTSTRPTSTNSGWLSKPSNSEFQEPGSNSNLQERGSQQPHSIIEQQDEEFETTLLQDQQKEKEKQDLVLQEKLLKEQQERLEREQKIAQKIQQQQMEAKSKQALRRLPLEPSQNAKNVTTVQVRWKDSKLPRRFNYSDTIQNIYDFVESKRPEIPNLPQRFHLVLPQNTKQPLTNFSQTLEDAKLLQSVVMITEA